MARYSKFLSLVLRHKPQAIGIRIDAKGWAKVDELLERSRQAGIPLTPELLKKIVEENDKQRFAFSPDGLRIRANQGHSFPVDLELEPVTPPEHLFHGTAARFLDSIRENGLVAGGRNHVHLSLDEHTAITVGQRHGSPVVLVILAGRMQAHGFDFYLSTNGIWLTEGVPREHIVFPQEDE